MEKCKFCLFEQKDLILKKYKYWTLVLAESQSHLGWTHAVLNRHAELFEELTDNELTELKDSIQAPK